MTSKYYARFDAHLKAVEGVNQQTIIGGTLTLFTTIIVLVLLYTEISGFFHIDVVSRMVADTTASVEAVRLTYDLEFYKIPCQQIDFMQEVTKGSVHFAEYSTKIIEPLLPPGGAEEPIWLCWRAHMAYFHLLMSNDFTVSLALELDRCIMKHDELFTAAYACLD